MGNYTVGTFRNRRPAVSPIPYPLLGELDLGAGRAAGAGFDSGAPVMWIELREVAWLASVVGSLSIVSIGVAVAVAMLAFG